MKRSRIRRPPPSCAVALTLVACAAVVAGSCAKKPFPNLKHESLPFVISFPPAWEKLEDYAGTDLLGRSPPEREGDPFRENVSVEVVFAQEGTTLHSYFEAYVKDLAGRLEAFEDLGTGSRKIGDLDSRWLSYRYEMKGKRIQARLYILVFHTRVFGITCASTPGEYARHAKTFEEIVQSFEPR